MPVRGLVPMGHAPVAVHRPEVGHPCSKACCNLAKEATNLAFPGLQGCSLHMAEVVVCYDAQLNLKQATDYNPKSIFIWLRIQKKDLGMSLYKTMYSTF